MIDEKEKALKEAMELEKENREKIRELIAEGKLPELKVMNRKQRRELGTSGYDFGKIRLDDKRTFTEIRDDMFDWILDHIYPDFNFDEVDNPTCNAFALLTYKNSMQDNLAAKNF